MSDCIEWTGAKTPTGYGNIMRNGKPWKAHRWFWTQKYGPIPDGLYVLHKCDNRSCVNVNHLYLGTQKDNMRDMRERDRAKNGIRYSERTECTQGHAYSPENTYITAKGARICRECSKERARQKRNIQRGLDT